MTKFFKRKCDRDFAVCSDCCYFEFTEYIDEKYPFKRGRCKLFNKNVDDRWETKCEELHYWLCEDCEYYKVFIDDDIDDDYEGTTCEYWDKHVEDCDYACDEFKQK